MNLKKRQIQRLRWEKPINITSIRIYRRRYRGYPVSPPEWCIEFKPKPPKGAVTWEIEGDEVVLTAHHPHVMLGYLRLVPGLPGVRTPLRSLIRRRRRRF